MPDAFDRPTDPMRWEGPPPPRKYVQDWVEIAKALKARPGEWAMVGVYPHAGIASGHAHRLAHGGYKGLRAGVIEAVSRTVDGEARVYARYVGKPS